MHIEYNKVRHNKMLLKKHSRRAQTGRRRNAALYPQKYTYCMFFFGLMILAYPRPFKNLISKAVFHSYGWNRGVSYRELSN